MEIVHNSPHTHILTYCIYTPSHITHPHTSHILTPSHLVTSHFLTHSHISHILTPSHHTSSHITHLHTQEGQFERFQRRAQSFHNTRRVNHNRSDSLGNGEKLAPPTQFGRNHPSRRAKTPTYKSVSAMKKPSAGGSGTGSSVGGNEKVPITRTTSLGKVNKIHRVEDSVTTAQSKVSDHEKFIFKNIW